jgi:putative hydrolase of the HAD superfamily
MLDLSNIRAMTLDLDDTLWPIRPTIERAEARLQEWLVQHAPATASLFSAMPARLALRAQVERDMPHISHDLSALRLETIRLALRSAGDPQGLAQGGFDVFFAARMDVKLYEEVEDALKRLSARMPLLALTNGNADVRRVGLGDFFQGSIGASEAGFAKPDPRIFLAAADALQCPPHQVLHVGDDPHMDVLGALDAGMHAAWVNRTGAEWQHPQTPHLHVQDLAQLCTRLGV